VVWVKKWPYSGGVEVTKEDSGGFEVTGQKGEPVEV
jgi:hypothetical protein